MTEAGHSFPLPADLPVPEDTGACIHLPGHPMPPLIELASTAGGIVDLFLLSLSRPVLVFVYPRTASPGEEVPASWNLLPGARGCTPQLCSIRDGLQPLMKQESELCVFGLSAQTPKVQQEAATRLALPYPLLSDEKFALQRALDLPTLQWEGRTYLQRVTLLLREGQITQVHYPVFPPDKAAVVALQMLNGSRQSCLSVKGQSSEEYLQKEERQTEGTAEAVDNVRATVAEFNEEEGIHQTRPTSRRLQSSRAPSDWRNSLVAIDNETGAVVGIVATNVRLEGDTATPEEEEVQTPLDLDGEDAFDRIAPVPPPKSSSEITETEEEQAFPPESVLYHAAHVYIDEDNRPSSRAGSVLGEATFAPPPVPTKPSQLRQLPVPRPDSVRTSSASANFFTARETSDDDESHDDDDDDDDDIDAPTKSLHHVAYGEAHRPELLRDEDDDGNRSDASGSTIGGPAVKLWRKARGGKEAEKRRMAKKQAKKEEQRQQVLANIKPTAVSHAYMAAANGNKRREPSQRSVESVRTSRAETAGEEGDFSSANDEDDEDDDEDENKENLSPGDRHASKRMTVVGDPLRESSSSNAMNPHVAVTEDNDGHSRSPTSATIKAMREQGHRPRALMATTEIRSVEDRVWRDALETETLPIDAPYTHLAVHNTENMGSGARKGSKDQTEGEGEEEDEEGVELIAKGQRRQPKARAAERQEVGKVLQGNSVLLDFLAGSRITASVIHADLSSLVPDARPPSSLQGPTVFTPTSLGNLERQGAMRFIPVLPQHLLWFFGFSSENESQPSLPSKDETTSEATKTTAAAAADSTSLTSNDDPAMMGSFTSALDPSTLVSAATHRASSALENLTNLGWSAGEWLIGSSWSTLLHSWGSSSNSDAVAAVGGEEDADEDAEEWEWSVPEFDPMSLKGTPRPIYRRKRPSPSFENGFQIRQQGQSTVGREPTIDESDVAGTVVARPTLLGSTPGTRYSIIHYDDLGVGRRALLRR